MRSFNNNNDRGFKSFGGRDSGGGRRSFSGGRNSERPMMFSAVCDKCGQDCEVPFKPSGEKPVYCSNCFEKINGDRDNNRSFDERRPRENNFRNEGFRNEAPRNESPRNEVSYKSDFEALNKKLDRILDLLLIDRENKEVKEVKEIKEVKKVSKVKKIKE
ncbi:MAG: CxxC-x17-CxxC domain-containing protein [Candidatus Shapirobacteria bacterium]|jgi:CxxC-x17-CxxC domain-containing protein